MIKIENNYIRIDTKANTLLLYVDSEIPQYLYYGPKLRTVNYAQFMAKEERTGMDLRRHTFSQYGRGDYREPSLKINNSNGSFSSRFVFVDVELTHNNLYNSQFPHAKNKAETVCFTLMDKENACELKLYYSTYFENDVITCSASLKNCGDKKIIINKIASLQIDFSSNDFSIFSFDGGWAKERMMHETKVKSGFFAIDSKTGSSSALHNPFVYLKNNTGVYGFNLIYSSNHKSSLEADLYNRSRFMIGINDFAFAYSLAPNETFITPEAIMVYAKDETKMSLAMHNFVQNHLIPTRFKAKKRPILLNNWEGTQFNFTGNQILKMAEIAKDLGVELFVLDDGWFGKRNDEHSSLGDWFDNVEKTGGLAKLAHNIHALGLDFGIWIEPEMISEDSQLYRQHPEYAMKIPNKEPYRHRFQLMLDLVNPDVQRYVIDSLINLIETTQANYIKWDYNRYFSDVYSEYCPSGEYFHRYICALYQIMDTITQKYPDVLFEGCAAGGARFDLGILCYMPQIWTSDNTDPSDRIYIQTGTLLAYPHLTMGCHVSKSPNGFTKRRSSLQTRFNIACFGNLGYELDATKLTNYEKKTIREQIAFYKQNRKFLQVSQCYQIGNIYQDKIGGFMLTNTRKTKILIALTSFKNDNHYCLQMPIKITGQYKLVNLSTKEWMVIDSSTIELTNLFLASEKAYPIQSTLYSLEKI